MIDSIPSLQVENFSSVKTVKLQEVNQSQHGHRATMLNLHLKQNLHIISTVFEFGPKMGPSVLQENQRRWNNFPQDSSYLHSELRTRKPSKQMYGQEKAQE